MIRYVFPDSSELLSLSSSTCLLPLCRSVLLGPLHHAALQADDHGLGDSVRCTARHRKRNSCPRPRFAAQAENNLRLQINLSEPHRFFAIAQLV